MCVRMFARIRVRTYVCMYGALCLLCDHRFAGLFVCLFAFSLKVEDVDTDEAQCILAGLIDKVRMQHVYVHTCNIAALLPRPLTYVPRPCYILYIRVCTVESLSKDTSEINKDTSLIGTVSEVPTVVYKSTSD